MSVLRITLSAGALIRGRAIAEIKKYCWLHNYEISVDEDKYFIYSDYRIKITVPDHKADIVKNTLKKWIERMEQ